MRESFCRTVKYHGFLRMAFLSLRDRQISPFVWHDGSIVWLEGKGTVGREGAPAVIKPSGREEWVRGSRLHRLDGPAVVHPDKSAPDEWWKDGKRWLEAEQKSGSGAPPYRKGKDGRFRTRIWRRDLKKGPACQAAAAAESRRLNNQYMLMRTPESFFMFSSA
jgi:hypothetical protein